MRSKSLCKISERYRHKSYYKNSVKNMEDKTINNYELAAKYIMNADVIFIGAGAGMGVGSGNSIFSFYNIIIGSSKD